MLDNSTTTTNTEEEIVNIQIPTGRKKFSINGDTDKILELDINDFGIVTRLKNIYPKLQEIAQKHENRVLEDTDDNQEMLEQMSDVIQESDKEMRKLVDELFNSNVSEVCAPNGTMLDLIGGRFRFEIIIDKLSDLYIDSVSKEFEEMKKDVDSAVSKYQ